MNKIEEILKKININIPNPPKPVGNYAAFNKSEKLIFISGQLPITADGKIITGKVIKEVSLEQAIDLIILHTRQFAKRQRTWFRADANIVWFPVDKENLLELVERKIILFLEGLSRPDIKTHHPH